MCRDQFFVRVSGYLPAQEQNLLDWLEATDFLPEIEDDPLRRPAQLTAEPPGAITGIGYVVYQSEVKAACEKLYEQVVAHNAGQPCEVEISVWLDDREPDFNYRRVPTLQPGLDAASGQRVEALATERLLVRLFDEFVQFGDRILSYYWLNEQDELVPIADPDFMPPDLLPPGYLVLTFDIRLHRVTVHGSLHQRDLLVLMPNYRDLLFTRLLMYWPTFQDEPELLYLGEMNDWQNLQAAVEAQAATLTNPLILRYDHIQRRCWMLLRSGITTSE